MRFASGYEALATPKFQMEPAPTAIQIRGLRENVPIRQLDLTRPERDKF